MPQNHVGDLASREDAGNEAGEQALASACLSNDIYKPFVRQLVNLYSAAWLRGQTTAGNLATGGWEASTGWPSVMMGHWAI